MHIYLVNKRTGQQWPTIYTCEPFFFFHVINAHQTEQGGGYVAVDVVAYKDAEVSPQTAVFPHVAGTEKLRLSRRL